MKRIHQNLIVYKLAFDLALEIFTLTRKFPKEETFSLTSQMVRSSRSVCANLAEAYRKRRYPKGFMAKLSDAEAEASETQTWLEFCLTCGYLTEQKQKELIIQYDHVIGMLVNMSRAPEKWKI